MIVLDKEDLNKIEFRWNHEVELSSYGREFFVSKAKISKNTNQEEKKIMKKICALFIILVLLLTGCSSPKTDDTADKNIEETKTLVVGLDDTFAPMGFRDDAGELVGFDIDLAKAIAAKIGYEVSFQPIDWAMKETELNSGNIDCIWNGYSITEERKTKVAFSTPYLDNAQLIITLSGSDIASKADLADKIVAVQKESSALDAVTADDIAASLKEIVEFDTNIDCFMDLEAGRCDAIVCDEVLARYIIKQRGEDKYNILSDDFGKEEYGIGFRLTDSELVASVDKALEDLKADGTYKDIYSKWFSE